MSTACDLVRDSQGLPANVICLVDSDFDQAGNLINFKDVDSVILYSVAWCGFCNKFKPEFAEFAKMIKGQPIRALYVDAVKNKDLVQRINPGVWGYQVKGFPQIVSYHRGKFYSEYGMDNPQTFRTAKDVYEYAQGIGKTDIAWQ